MIVKALPVFDIKFDLHFYIFFFYISEFSGFDFSAAEVTFKCTTTQNTYVLYRRHSVIFVFFFPPSVIKME